MLDSAADENGRSSLIQASDLGNNFGNTFTPFLFVVELLKAAPSVCI